MFSHGTQPTLSILVPVFNSEKSLRALVDRLHTVLAGSEGRFEIVLVNDASRDGSWQVIGDLAARHSGVKGICLTRNCGQHNALLCGIRAARNEVIITLDDDLQNPPEEIPKLLAKLAEGFDVVYGKPERPTHGLWRNLGARITKRALQCAGGVEMARNVSTYRAFRTELRNGFAHYSGPYVSIDVLLSWSTSRFGAVAVAHQRRAAGLSNYTLAKLIGHALNMMTGFSAFPLQWASWVGFSFTLVGLGVLVWVVGRYFLEGDSVPGFPFLASIIALFAGAQMFALGIMGEYLARIHFRMMERPPYVVRATVASHAPSGPLGLRSGEPGAPCGS